MKNLLKTIILGTAIGLISCSYYSGKIGNESVFLYEGLVEKSITITKPDGKTIEYIDNQGYRSENKIEEVKITKDKYSVTYINDEIGKEALAIAQKQYEDYLVKILEAKKKKALEDIQ